MGRRRFAVIGAGAILLIAGSALWLLRNDTPERAFGEFDAAMRAGRYEDASRRVSAREIQIIWGSRPQFVRFCRTVLPDPRALRKVHAQVTPRRDTSGDQLQLYDSDAGREVHLTTTKRIATVMMWRDPEGHWGVSAQPYVHFAVGIAIRRADYYRKLHAGLVAAGITNYVHDGVLSAESAPRDELLRVADGSIPYIDEVLEPLSERNEKSHPH